MNVMKLVADTVRKQTAIFRHASATAQPLIADPEKEPHKHQIQKLAIYNLSPETSATVQEKISAINTIGHLSWTGGPSAAEFTGSKYFQILISMLQNESETHRLRLQIVKSLSEICNGCKRNQDLSRNYSTIDVIVTFMTENEDDPETRKWCLHTLFFLLVGNRQNQTLALQNSKFVECVKHALTDTWEGWEYNEAEELSLMLKLT